MGDPPLGPPVLPLHTHSPNCRLQPAAGELNSISEPLPSHSSAWVPFPTLTGQHPQLKGPPERCSQALSLTRQSCSPTLSHSLTLPSLCLLHGFHQHQEFCHEHACPLHVLNQTSVDLVSRASPLRQCGTHSGTQCPAAELSHQLHSGYFSELI